jgi:uncharacterized membrane protein
MIIAEEYSSKMQSKNKAYKAVLYVHKSSSPIKFPAFLLTIHGVYVFVYTIHFIANKLLS